MTSSSKSVDYLFWILCIVGLFAILSSTMSKNPVLNPLARALNTPESLLGFVAAASTIPGILVSLPAGSLSDILGRRRVLLVSGFVFASAPFLYLFINSWWQLALVRFYHGFATAMFVPVANAFVAELFPSKKGERISLFSSATAIGRTIAPLIGGYILFVTSYGFNQLYLVVESAGFIALVIMLLFLKGGPRYSDMNAENQNERGVRILRGWAAVASDPRIIATSLVEASQYYAYGAVEFFLVGYLKEVAHLDALSIGIISGLQVAMIPVSKPFMGRLSDKIGRRIVIIMGSLLAAAAIVIFPFIGEVLSLLLVSVLYGIGFSMVTSATPALVSELTQRELIGTGMGFLSTMMDVGQTLGPIITGFILGAGFGYTGSFIGISSIISIVSVLFIAIELIFRPITS